MRALRRSLLRVASLRPHARRIAPWAGYALVGALSCSSSVTGTISLITGYNETDPFTLPPPPTTLQILATDQEGGTTVLAQSPLPVTSGTLALPNENTSTTASFTAVGFDDAGDAVLWGQTLPVEYSSLEGLSLPLYVQRTGLFSRLPSTLPSMPPAPSLLTLLAGRFVVSVGSQPAGDAGAADASAGAPTEIYDLLTWSPLSSPPTMPVVPVAIVGVGTQVLLVNGAETEWYDFSDSETSAATVSSGGSFSQITGGVTVINPVTGDGYIVSGAGPVVSTAALSVSAATLTDITITSTQPRAGAAAAWDAAIDPPAVVIAGGSPSAPGAEIVQLGVQQSTPLQYPPDGTTGAGAAVLAGGTVLLAGGVRQAAKDAGGGLVDAGVRLLLDPQSCLGTTNCPVSKWNVSFDPMLVSAQAFTLSPGTAGGDGGVTGAEVLVIGNDAGNQTHAFTVTEAGATTLSFKDPRQGAAAIQLPFGSIAVVSGNQDTIEAFPLL